MSGSSVIGQPPNTQNDHYIVRALVRLLQLNIDNSKGISFGPLPPNVRDDSRGQRIVAGCIILIILITLITGSRLLIRGLHQKLKWGWDDWFIIPAALCAIAWYVVSIIMVVYGGGGRHVYFLTYEEYNVFRKMGQIALVFFIPASVSVKVSIALFVRRFTGLYSRTWLWINNVFLFLLLVQFLAFTLFNTFGCNPVAGTFDLIPAGKSATPMKCGPYLVTGKVRVYFNVIFDFALLSTPVIIMWKVQMPIAKKIRICGIFALGSIPCVASVMTVVTSSKIESDITYSFISLQNWLMVDLFFGIVVASAPILYPQLLASWTKMSTAVRNRLSSDKSRSQQIPDERSSDHETLQSEKRYRLDDVEMAYALGDGESGNKVLLEDQRPWAESSVQVPDRAYHHSTSVTGTMETICSSSLGARSEKGSVS